jgi:hypothetical protein
MSGFVIQHVLRTALLCAVVSLMATAPVWPQQFEVGGHLALVHVPETDDQPIGFGARAGFLPLSHIAIEGEVTHFGERNYFPEIPNGSLGFTLLVAGVKAGRAFGPAGLFVKARPGVVYFRGDAIRAYAPDIDNRFAMDLGLVVEADPPGPLVIRFDIGDTIIRLGEVQTQPGAPETLRIGTAHLPQGSVGLSFRF